MPVPAEGDVRSAVIEEAERLEEDAKFSSQTQFEMSKKWRARQRWLNWPSAVLAAVAGVGGLSELLSATSAGWVAVAAAATGALVAVVDPASKAAQSASAANAIGRVQKRLRRLYRVEINRLDEDGAADLLDSLAEQLGDLNAEAPVPDRKSFERARQNIEGGGQTHAVDARKSD